MARDWIDRMTYADFAEGFSVGEPQKAEDRSYLASNETKFSGVIDRIMMEAGNSPLYFMGVIGRVDRGFHYISTLNPERSFLFDIAMEPVHHLGLRLCAFDGAADIREYLMNMRSMGKDGRRKIIECDSLDRSLKMLRDYEPNPFDLVGQGMDFAGMLGYDQDKITPDLMRILTDAGFRKEAAVACINHYGRLQAMALQDKDLLRNCWQHPPNFKRVKDAALDGRVRGFNADLLHGFSHTADLLREDHDIKNLVLYISKIPDAIRLQLAWQLKVKGQKVGDLEFNRIVDNAVHDTLEAMLDPLADKLDRLWVVSSHNDENRIIGTK